MVERETEPGATRRNRTTQGSTFLEIHLRQASPLRQDSQERGLSSDFARSDWAILLLRWKPEDGSHRLKPNAQGPLCGSRASSTGGNPRDVLSRSLTSTGPASADARAALPGGRPRVPRGRDGFITGPSKRTTIWAREPMPPDPHPARRPTGSWAIESGPKTAAPSLGEIAPSARPLHLRIEDLIMDTPAPAKQSKGRVLIAMANGIAEVVLNTGIMNTVARQWRKPSGRLGRWLARAMNSTHSMLTDWGLRQVSIGTRDTLLDIGCGGGGTVRKLAEIAAAGKVYGIDHSEESVSVSKNTNRTSIGAGRVEIRQGGVSSLPFPDKMFDLATAVNTHYYWPDLVNDMREVLRVLKPGGMLILIGQGYKGAKYGERDLKFLKLADPKGTAYPSEEELDELFSTAGYNEVHVLVDFDRGWIRALGRKPT